MARRSVIMFTLIELLIVIAVVAILASLLLPAFGKARMSARAAGCLCNARQVGGALQMYTADFDDYFPPFCPNNSSWYPSWVDRLYAAEVKNYSIFLCPDADDVTIGIMKKLETVSDPLTTVTYANRSSFGINAYRFDQTAGERGLALKGASAKVIAIKSPSSIIMLAESCMRSGGGETYPNRGYYLAAPYCLDQNDITGKHGSAKANFVFADGHGENSPVLLYASPGAASASSSQRVYWTVFR